MTSGLYLTVTRHGKSADPQVTKFSLFSLPFKGHKHFIPLTRSDTASNKN